MAAPLPKVFTLNNGLKIPSIGLGTWQSPPGQVRAAVAHALKVGYRHIDCAWAYHNQGEVGQGIRDSGVPREEIWITSKLFELHHKHVRASIQDTLKDLGLDYLDLFLVHWPFALEPDVPADGSIAQGAKVDPKTGKNKLDEKTSYDNVTTWRDMEKLVDEGLTKSIGLSNFNIRRTRNILQNARIKPVANQVELSLTCHQPELVEWLIKNQILPQAYSPLGSTGAKITTIDTVDAVAKKHNVSGATVILSWLVARGINPLPKSVTPKYIEGNLNLAQLSQEEVASLSKFASEQTLARVCDQSNDFDQHFDIFETSNAENNDKVQAKLA